MKTQIGSFVATLFILLFTYASFSKLLAFNQFRKVLSGAPIIGKYAPFFAVLIPVLELIIVILLVLPRSTTIGLMAGTILLIVFTIYLAFMVLTDPHLPCSCGGVIEQLSWKQHIVFNVLFILLGITGIYFQCAKEKQRTDILQKT